MVVKNEVYSISMGLEVKKEYCAICSARLGGETAAACQILRDVREQLQGDLRREADKVYGAACQLLRKVSVNDC